MLPLTEGLGDNCELGLYLERRGLARGFLLRFARLSSDELIRYLGAPSRAAFAFDDLIPYSKAMVRDRATGISFHSSIRSVRTDDGWRFDAGEAERRALYAQEKTKYDFLLERFENSLRSQAPRVYVIKANAGLPGGTVAAVDAALRQWRHPDSFVLLAVGPPHAADVDADRRLLEWRSDTVCCVEIERLAPYHRAADIDMAGWDAIFEKLATAEKIRGGLMAVAD